MNDPTNDNHDLQALGVDDAAVARLQEYLDRLLDANRRFNLTAIKDRDVAWSRHIVESLHTLPLLPAKTRSLIDVGSGGGLPGLPLAIARPELEVTLLEATSKKARFLSETAEALNLTRVRVVTGRAEELSHQPGHREAYDVVTARAVAAMPVLLELTLPFVRVGGRVLAIKGANVQNEMLDLTRALSILGGATPSLHPLTAPGAEGCVVEVGKRIATRRGYPRPPGRPAQSPL